MFLDVLVHEYQSSNYVFSGEEHTLDEGWKGIFQSLDGCREGMVSTRCHQRQWHANRHEGPIQVNAAPERKEDATGMFA